MRKPEETLYVYLQDYEVDENDEVVEYDAKWRVSLARASRLRRRLRPGASISVRLGIS